jgi:Ca-activated chloride channel family protein
LAAKPAAMPGGMGAGRAVAFKAPPSPPASPAPSGGAPMQPQKTMMIAMDADADDSFGSVSDAKRDSGVMNKVKGLFSKKRSEPQLERTKELERGDLGDPVVALLGRQLASGLWEGGGDDAGRLRATAKALLELHALGISTTHALHAAQVKKAVDAILAVCAGVAAKDAKAAQLALGAAWLVATGARSRKELTAAVKKSAPALEPLLAGDESALIQHLSSL